MRGCSDFYSSHVEDMAKRLDHDVVVACNRFPPGGDWGVAAFIKRCWPSPANSLGVRPSCRRDATPVKHPSEVSLCG